MALGTITNVAIDPHSSSQAIPAVADIKITVTTVVGDSSYPTGGTAITGAQLGLPTGTVLFTICSVTGSASNNTAAEASYNTATGKLQMWSLTDSAGCPLAETANATNVSGITVTIVAWGY